MLGDKLTGPEHALDTDLYVRLTVQLAAAEASRCTGRCVAAQVDIDGVITWKGDRDACLRAFLTVGSSVAGLRSDCELAEAMGLGVQFVAGPPAALDELRGLLGLSLRFIVGPCPLLRMVEPFREAL